MSTRVCWQGVKLTNIEKRLQQSSSRLVKSNRFGTSSPGMSSTLFVRVLLFEAIPLLQPTVVGCRREALTDAGDSGKLWCGIVTKD